MARKQAKGKKDVSGTEAVEEMRAVRLELPLSVHNKFRIEAAKEDTSMASIARQLVEEGLAKREGRCEITRPPAQ